MKTINSFIKNRLHCFDALDDFNNTSRGTGVLDPKVNDFYIRFVCNYDDVKSIIKDLESIDDVVIIGGDREDSAHSSVYVKLPNNVYSILEVLSAMKSYDTWAIYYNTDGKFSIFNPSMENKTWESLEPDQVLELMIGRKLRPDELEGYSKSSDNLISIKADFIREAVIPLGFDQDKIDEMREEIKSMSTEEFSKRILEEIDEEVKQDYPDKKYKDLLEGFMNRLKSL